MNIRKKHFKLSVYLIFFISVFWFNSFCPENSDPFGLSHGRPLDLITEFCEDNFSESGQLGDEEKMAQLAQAIERAARDNGALEKLTRDLESYKELKNEYPEGAVDYISNVHQMDPSEFRNMSYSIASVYDLSPLENQISLIEKTISDCCLKFTESMHQRYGESNESVGSAVFDNGLSSEDAKNLIQDLKSIQAKLEEYQNEVNKNSISTSDDLAATRRGAKIKRLGALIINDSLRICGNLVVNGKFCVGGVDILALLLNIQASISSTQCQGISTIIGLLNTLIALVTTEFNSTFTILADLTNTVTTCCVQTQNNFNTTFSLLNEILSTLTTPTIVITFGAQFDATFTAIAELQNTLTACCAQTQQDFDNTWTILAAIENTIITDFNSTWTILANISSVNTFTAIAELQNTVTACCAQTQQDFDNTWTILAAIENTIVTDFNSTWTILANISSVNTFTAIAELQNTVTACCAQTQQDFDNTWTILAAIENTIVTDFNSTWTILAHIQSSIATTTAVVDLSGTFTAIAELQNTVTACCAQTQSDFNATWTILAAIENTIVTDFNSTWTILAQIQSSISTTTAVVDLSGTFTAIAELQNTVTACCAQTQQDFNNTWTILAAISNEINNLSIGSTFTVLNTINVNVLNTFTAIAELQNTVTACCEQTQQDFNNTWTILAAISNEINNLSVGSTFTVLNTINVNVLNTFTAIAELQETVTACCAQTQQDFNNTWTILAQIQASISTTTAVVDLSGTFTAIAELQNTLTACCAQTQQDFDNTWTILATINTNVLNTFTSIAELQNTVVNDFNSTWTILANISSVNTFTAIAELQNTLTACCAQTQQDFDNTWTILATINTNVLNTFTSIANLQNTVVNDFNSTWTIEANILNTIVSDFNSTWTILANISSVNTFTAIAELQNTLTACCAQTQQDFDNTWTILATINTNVLNTFTSIANLQNTVVNDFNSTWTIEANILNTIVSDFNSTWTILANISSVNTFTAIAELQNTVTACCAQTQQDFNNTWTILATINTNVLNTFTSIANLQNTVVNDFNSTWTILAAIENTIVSDFNSTWTILANISSVNTFTAIADLKNSVTACCAQTQQDFNNTWTILATINTNVLNTFTSIATLQNTVVNDFNSTWTILANISSVNTFTAIADLKNSVTACCAQTQQDFNNTWTILATINTNVLNTFTSIATLQNTVVNDFNSTWTILANISSVNTFTAIAELQNTVTACCAQTQQDFNNTWTILATINTNVLNTFTSIATLQNTVVNDFNSTWTILSAINNTIISDFAATWTILANLSNAATFTVLNTINTNVLNTFTAIADLKNSVTACCAQTQQDFNNTWTILATINTNVLNTFTAIANISTANTFTVLNTINTNVLNTFTSIAALQTIVVNDFAATWTILATLNADECAATIITQANFGSGSTPYVITTSGVYRLGSDISFTGANNTTAITINSSYVTLDLSCFTLRQTNASTGVNGVVVSSNYTDVIVTGGRINGFTGTGLTLQSNVDRYKILATTITSCATGGIALNGTSGTGTLNEGLINNCDIFSCSTANGANSPLFINYASDLKINTCRVNLNGLTSNALTLTVVSVNNSVKVDMLVVDACDNSGSSGFLMNAVTNSSFKYCTARSNTVANGSIYGFDLVSSSTCNTFDTCTAGINSGTTTAYGFLVNANCNDNLFINSRAVNNISTGASASAIAYGFSFNNAIRLSCISCFADSNNATSSTAGLFGAFGFDLNTCNDSLLYNCIALGQTANAGVTASSVGIRNANGANNTVRNCQASRNDYGYRIEPNNATIAAFVQNIATKNTNPYSQFISGSTSISTDISNLNAVTAPWTNISVN